VVEDAIDEDGESVDTERKASVYLDAQEEDPSVADILRELRELPDTPREDEAVSDDRDTFDNEVRQAAAPALLQPTTASTAPPSITSPPAASTSSKPGSISAQRKGRRRSGLRHSFSSAIRVSARTEGEQDAKGVKADAVVELHEESASAFQDFLFWCYPQ